jgi:hypothetical protein
MNFLHTLRNSPWLAKLALLWFALTLGVAVASPLVSPQNQVQICSAAGGMVKIVLNDDGTSSNSPAALDCPLCVVGHVAPPVAIGVSHAVSSLGRVLQSIPAASIAAHTAAPPPSRGPPVFL